MTLTNDGGFIVAGGSTTWPGLYVIKANANGDVQWVHSYGVGGYDQARRVRPENRLLLVQGIGPANPIFAA